MRKVTQSFIRSMIRDGIAQELTPENIPAIYEKVMYSSGVYGLNGGVIRDTKTGELYAVPSRSTTLFMIF